MYCIIDIETTGGSSRGDKITEIAIYKHDGTKVVDEFVTLINPERTIPHYITQMTGISNEMVEHAPKFYEVAKRIVEITEDTVFVAHNVMFDYGFVRSEFKMLGFDFDREKLCTVRMSRKAFPGLKSYSLGKLCKQRGIVIEDRHRAAGDARATTILFEQLMSVGKGEMVEKSLNKGVLKKDLNPNIDPQKLKDLPEEPGVYYFYDDNHQLIYIGKSKNIKSRVYTHLRGSKTVKGEKMRKQIADIDFECTGSELIALLKESHEIKQYRPYYNRAQKRVTANHAIVAEYSPEGYIVMNATKPGKYQEVVVSYGKLSDAKAKLYELAREFELCDILVGLENGMANSPCFHYHLKQCNGACVGKEAPESYNLRAKAALDQLQFKDQNFILLDKGRSQNERSVVVVEQGRYLGYGYADTDLPTNSIEELKEQIDRYPDNRNVRSIIKSFLGKIPDSQVIKF